MTSTVATRRERDSMGEFEVPADAYYGATSMRAKLNFPISDLRFNRGFIRALGLIKQSAAAVNEELGLLEARLADAIRRAAQEVADGRFDDQFVVDIFQTGSGTSTNMNANEVISNRAIELLGGERGSRNPVHPNDHVNMGQSSNDVIPTAIHVAAAVAIQDELLPALAACSRPRCAPRRRSSGRSSRRAAPICRTPRRSASARSSWATSARSSAPGGAASRRSASSASWPWAAPPSAPGSTGTSPRRSSIGLAEATGVAFAESDNHFQAQATLDNVVAASGALRSVAVSLYKIASDIRLMGRPRATWRRSRSRRCSRAPRSCRARSTRSSSSR